VPGNCWVNNDSSFDTCTILVVADYDGMVAETDENNNFGRGVCSRPAGGIVPDVRR
jgi:hypothetical protein